MANHRVNSLIDAAPRGGPDGRGRRCLRHAGAAAVGDREKGPFLEAYAARCRRYPEMPTSAVFGFLQHRAAEANKKAAATAAAALAAGPLVVAMTGPAGHGGQQ